MKERITPTWHEHFLKLVEGVKEKSKDPSKQVGAIIVNAKHRIIATGYNGFPSNCDKKFMSYKRPDKYPCIIHGEMNAILYAGEDLEGTTLYTSNAPCEECLKHIVQSKISTVYYQSADIMQRKASFHQLLAIRRLMKGSGIVIQNIQGVSYIDDLRPHYAFEMFHPDGQMYKRHELREANSYLVYSKKKQKEDYSFTQKPNDLYGMKQVLKGLAKEFLEPLEETEQEKDPMDDFDYIATVTIIAGLAYTQDDERLEGVLAELDLKESDVLFNRI